MNRSGISRTFCLTLILAAALLALPAFAADGEKEAASKETEQAKSPENESNVSPLVQASRKVRGEKKETGAKVYGNDDLDEMFGPSESTPPVAQAQGSTEPTESTSPAEGEAQPDALEQMFANEARKKEQAIEIAGAEQRVADAKQKIADLEKRMLAVKNPLLARPSAPEEGAEEWNAGDAGARVRQTEQQIADARKALAEAERELSELKRGS